MSKPYISLKIISKRGAVLHKIGSRKTRRVFHFIQANRFSNCLFCVKVNYGKGFTNEGEYKTKKDLLLTLRVFLKK